MIKTPKHAVVISGMESDRFEQVIFISGDEAEANVRELLPLARVLNKAASDKKTGFSIAVLAMGFLTGCAATVFVWLLCLML